MSERMDIEPGGLYTLKEARTYLRISDATARRWLKSGLLRGQKIGRDYRIRGQDLAERMEWKARDLYPLPKPLSPGSHLLKLIGIGDSGHTDIAERHDDYLAEIYAAEARPREEGE